MNIIQGTNGSDVLNGTAGNDIIYGYGGNDTIDAGGGADTVHAGSGFNTVRLGAGDDRLNVTGLRGWYDGGSGHDTIDFSARSQNGDFNLATGIGKIGTNPVFTMVNFESIITGSGHDTVRGTNGFNFIQTGAGNDTVFAGGGNDIVHGGDGEDILYGEDGDDNLNGGRGNDELYGGNGNDTLHGGLGNDFLWGGDGTDILYGGYGNDVIDGWHGFDTVTYATHGSGVVVDIPQSKAYYSYDGKLETDTIFRVEKVIGSSHDDYLFAGATTEMEGGAGRDVIYSGSGANKLDGGDGVDTLSYQFSTAGVTVDLHAKTAAGGWAAGDQISGFENLRGSSHADTLHAHRNGSVLDGRDGDDVIRGHNGQDTLIGGRGADTLYGGSGRDIFKFESVEDSPWLGSKQDVILDFRKGTDKIDLSAIDANTHAAGNNAFTKIIFSQTAYNRTDFTAGTINVRHSGSDTWVDLNVTQTNATYGKPHYDPVEMSFKLVGHHNLALDDFIL